MGGMLWHLSLDAERDRDVLAMHQDVEQDVAVVRHPRQSPRCGVLAQLRDEVSAGSLGVAHGVVVVELVEPAGGAHSFDHHRQRTRRQRCQCDVRGDILDPPTITERRGTPLLVSEAL